MRTIHSAFVTAAAVACAVVSQGRHAHAASRLFHAADCWADKETFSGTPNYNASSGQVGSTGPGTVNFLCPVVTDAFPSSTSFEFQPLETATISVDGWARSESSGTSSFSASACRVFRSGAAPGGSCGTAVRNNPGGFVVHLAPSASGIWTSASVEDARFILVTLGPGSGGSFNVLWSYNVSY